MGEIIQDRDYLLKQQYRQPDCLQARIFLHRAYGTNAQSWTAWVYDQMQPVAGMSLLEVGCGTGALWQEQGGCLPADCRLVLSDLSHGMLTTARGNLVHLPQAVFYRGDALLLPFADGMFDMVAAHHMLYHVSDLQAALQEIRRVLRPGGWLFAATNGITHMRELHNLLVESGNLLKLESVPHANDSARLFGLESGILPLEKVFARVERVDFVQHLQVSAVQPLIDYIYSMWGHDLPHEDELRRRIQAEIDHQGFFFISKSQGMLKAQR
jgi:ubiquinone/menaquinone biosynthesis C-methylase UbiE